jgi:serine/threonine protein kinase
MVELERHKLQTWAEEAGFFDNPPKLLFRDPDVPYVKEILAHLEETLLDVNKLKARYDLDLTETEEEICNLDDDNSTVAQLAPQQQRRLSQIFQLRTSPWKKLRWIAVDEKNVRRLLDDVKGFVVELERFLEHSRQVKLDHAFTTILRATVVRSANEQELNVLGHGRSDSFSEGAIPAAARWRRQGLLLGVLESDVADASIAQSQNFRSKREMQSLPPAMSSTIPSPTLSSFGKSMRLTSTKLTLPGSLMNASRYFAWYEGESGVLEPVLLEWKTGRGGIKLKDLESRVDKVSAFLHELEPSFHSLQCRGYIKDWAAVERSPRYGYIFDLPFSVYPHNAQQSAVLSHMDRPPLPHMHTLRNMLDRQVEIPSLNLRFTYAIILLETLLQLHTAGWLHKELRSDNILFIQRPPYDQDGGESILLSPMYIAGYVYARLDNPHEMTEPTESGSENDLYRHPLSMGNSKLSYRKSFDIFSAGCVLLELGLWRSFPGILRRRPGTFLRRRDSHQEDAFPSVRESGSFRRSSSSLGASVRRSSNHSITRPGIESSISTQSIEGLRERRSSNLALRRSIHFVDADTDQDGTDLAGDLLELRHQLLLADLEIGNKAEDNAPQSGAKNKPLGGILKDLERAAGTTYTKIVRRCLQVTENLKELRDRSGLSTVLDEHVYALKLEMESLDALRAIAKVL